MDIELFAKMINDRHFPDYEKMKYKYGGDLDLFLRTLDKLYYKKLPIKDFDGNNIVLIENGARINPNAAKTMLKLRSAPHGERLSQNEIISTCSIEDIFISRESVKNILKGLAPRDEEEERALGMKKGLDFISDASNKITSENLRVLYEMSINKFLPDESRLRGDELYRRDAVYVVSDRIEHTGANFRKIPQFMEELIEFINGEDGTDDLVKASVVHFYIGYIHPYFDGNGRIARLLHLWFLIQKGYKSALCLPFSSQIEKSRKAYYNAYTVIENNKRFSGKIDVTPFAVYFADNVYNTANLPAPSEAVFEAYDDALRSGKVTKKESELWRFVLSFYGTDEFSLKQLEKDFGGAAYATIRAFALKFEEMKLLSSARYGARVRYFVNQ